MNNENGNGTGTVTVVQKMTDEGGKSSTSKQQLPPASHSTEETLDGGLSGPPVQVSKTNPDKNNPCCLCCLKFCLGYDPTSYSDDE